MKARLFFYCAIIIFACSSFASAKPGAGKFYIIGMGTAPDLISVRGARAIEKADIVLVESEYDKNAWKEYIEGKEIWYRTVGLRIMYGADPARIKDPEKRAKAELGARARQQLTERITGAVRNGKIVADLQGGDPMVYGLTFMLEMLPSDIETEIVPGIGAFQAASAAVKMSTTFGYDTSAVILTMKDWEGRVDTNEKLMVAGSSLVVYTMLLDFGDFFSKLNRHYPADTPVALVCSAGDLSNQKIIGSTVSRFMQEVDLEKIPMDRSILLVGKFLKVGQKRKDFVPQITEGHPPVTLER
ncbi:MAG TPA: SAM-dependent methyltransferase [Spirochaetota bacterium]|nr:SAM-dependent methyltransferase [Spirochaetota bacterium]HRZ27970.1 SAM-dependent methyltransferase [Spirochaetota bacterium]